MFFFVGLDLFATIRNALDKLFGGVWFGEVSDNDWLMFGCLGRGRELRFCTGFGTDDQSEI